MEQMTTPQDMEPDPKPHGILYRFAQRLFAWSIFATGLVLIAGTVFLVGLLLYRGIVWAWPW